MPLSAMFILFDFVVHNPRHPETKQNLSFLGAASGYFCRLEYVSGGKIQSSEINALVDIATQYVRDEEKEGLPSTTIRDQPFSSQAPLTAGVDMIMDYAQLVSSVSIPNYHERQFTVSVDHVFRVRAR